MPDSNIQEGAYNYAYLDEQTKRMIRRPPSSARTIR